MSLYSTSSTSDLSVLSDGITANGKPLGKGLPGPTSARTLGSVARHDHAEVEAYACQQ